MYSEPESTSRTVTVRAGVDADDLGTDPHVDVERVAQALRSLQEQPIAVGDHLADVIGQTAVGEGDVVSALER